MNGIRDGDAPQPRSEHDVTIVASGQVWIRPSGHGESIWNTVAISELARVRVGTVDPSAWTAVQIRRRADIPTAFYRTLRLRRAKALVEQTSFPISEISIACGFGQCSGLPGFLPANSAFPPLGGDSACGHHDRHAFIPINPKDPNMHLSRFPRLHLAHLPTPLEPMERLSKELGVELWIKRDDCTGMSTGGNKTRKLEFLMAEAMEQGADMVMTQGATQTNHGAPDRRLCRQAGAGLPYPAGRPHRL